jgi:hypothetical protein
MFNPGDEVECLDDEGSSGFLQKGQVYKVRRWKPPEPNDKGPDREGYLDLYGLDPGVNGFWATRFRRISEPKSTFEKVDFLAITRSLCG